MGVSMKSKFEENNLVIFLEGRITSDNSEDFKNEIEKIINEKKYDGKIIFDASKLEYISSAGLRVLLYFNKMQKGNILVKEVNSEVYEILSVTGFTSMFEVKKQLRNISVDNLEIIGQGAMGTVYRIDEDTIVKVYNSSCSIEEVEKEKEMAKQAFLLGIPTAISFDIVKVGDQYGSVFEMIKAKNFNDLMIENPDKQEEIVRQYASFLKQIHKVEMEVGKLPQIKDIYLEYVDEIKDYFTKDETEKLKKLFLQMPEETHAIHGDVQMKNVMLDGDTPLLIDMDGMSLGNPVFDLQGVYVTYCSFAEDEEDNTMKFLGLSSDVCKMIYEKTLDCYFEGQDKKVKKENDKKIRMVAYVRFLHMIVTSGTGLEELRDVRIRHTVEHIREDLVKIDSLEIYWLK